MIRLMFSCWCLILISSCQRNADGRNLAKAKRFQAEGIEIIHERNASENLNSGLATELNKKAIEKFSAAYKADTLFSNAVLYASECTMYAKDYKSCIYWTSLLKRLDTTQWVQNLCKSRIPYCNKQLQSKQEK